MGSRVKGKHALERTKPPRHDGARKGGQRKAPRPRRGPAGIAPKLPPVLGGMAIAGAVAGSLITAPGDLAAHVLAAQERPVGGYAGTDVISGRERAISRDLSSRPALKLEAENLSDDLAAQTRNRTLELQRLATSAEQYSKELKANRWVLPIANYRLTGRFGDRSSLWSRFHTGLDFAAPTGTRIVSIAAGTVIFTGYDGSYGNKVVVRLKDGTEIWYCHQSRILVSVGDLLAARSLIGEVGSTGNVTGPHLHLEVRPNGLDPIDPEIAFPQHGVAP